MNSNLRLLLVSPVPPPFGGMARWTELFVAECLKRSIEVFVVNSNISVKRGYRKNRSWLIFDEISRNCTIIRSFFKQLKKNSPDIVHICSPCSPFGLIRDFLCVLICPKSTHLILHCHCNIEDQIKNRFGLLMFKKTARRCHNIFVLNSRSKRFVDIFFPDKSVIVPNFIDRLDVNFDFKVKEHIRQIIYVGHLKKSKGVVELFKVASMLPDISFLLVGPLLEIPSVITTPANVIFKGEVDHSSVIDLMKASDVFLFPSHTEGFSCAVLEAMSVGLPIVATDVGANKDQIQDKGGIITPIGDYDSMVRAIISMDDPVLRKEMSSWNMKKVSEFYLGDKVIDSIIRIYDKFRMPR